MKASWTWKLLGWKKLGNFQFYLFFLATQTAKVSKNFPRLKQLGAQETLRDMALLWQNELPLAVLNGGFMGPSDDAVIHMIREALRGPDNVDRLLMENGSSSG